MTKEELLKTHPDYDGWIFEWQFFIRSYFGGRLYRDGNYLLQHPFESVGNYNRRRMTAYYYNYCAPIADIMTSYLFRKEAKRDYGQLTDNPLFNEFLIDSDFEGSNFSQFMREAQRFAAVYGRVSIVVDKPKMVASTQQEAVMFGIRPYLSLITPENLIDWSYIRLSNGMPALDMVKIKEDKNLYRIWTRESWDLWEVLKQGNDVRLVESGEHNLGVVPVVNLYNKKSGVRMIGLSDIQDVADINKNIYYLCSDAKEIIENTAFPMLALPYEKGGSGDEREVGPKNILQFDPETANAKPYWLEAPHSSLTEIREWVRQDIAEIFRIAKMGGVKATEESGQPRSGVALELEYQQMHSALAEKADNLEQAEEEVLKLWTRWEGCEFDGFIDYPDDFSVRDLDRDLERLLKAQSARIDSAVFLRELQKAISSAILPKIGDEMKKEIMREIDERAGRQ